MQQQQFAFVPMAAVTDAALGDIDMRILAYLGTLGFEEGFGGYAFEPLEEIAQTLHYSCEQAVAALTILIAHGYVEMRQARILHEADGRIEERTVYRTCGGVTPRKDAHAAGSPRERTHMQRDYSGVDAARGDFSYQALDGLSFRDARLIGATFQRATLSAAKFVDANLCGADLRGARLVMADLRNATLNGADLRGANLCRADLRGALSDEDTCFDEQTVLDCAQVDPGSRFEQAKLGRLVLRPPLPHPEPDTRGRTVEFIGWQERQRRLTE